MRTATNFATIGDTAIIESYTWMAARANLLFGPYSRFQWHHPGPLYFFWLVPFYVASGTRPAGLSLGAVTLNMSMVAIASAILIRRGWTRSAIKIGETVVMGYVDQSRDTLDPNKTVWEEISGGEDILTLGARKSNSRPAIMASPSTISSVR